VKLCMEEVPEIKELDEASLTIDPDWCTTKPMDDHFVCGICTNVVRAPQECQQCQKLLCTGCIKHWL
jgi:hypothetical protein